MSTPLFDQLDDDDDSDGVEILTVSDLTHRIKHSLEQSFPEVWVSGEISNLSKPRSGHLYFDLKDEGAVVKSVVWRSRAARLGFEIEDGQQVICAGGLDVYPPHGNYKLIVNKIEPVGIGALQRAFEQLHRRLAAEGLFDPEFKQPLPRYPKRVAIVTSPTGAAIHDFVQTMRRRWPLTRLLVIPARVQGTGAANEIAEAIELANLLNPKLDLIVAGRGGGSMEDLWAFNEEVVVRAIFASRLPVVSAVGHEVDVTLSDLVADARALTPTAAAEMISPSMDEVIGQLRQRQERMKQALTQRAYVARQRLEALSRRPAVRRPLDGIRAREQRLDELARRADRAVQGCHDRSAARIAQIAARLEAISPLAVLARGYAVVRRDSDEMTVRDAGELQPGDSLTCRFALGSAQAKVTDVNAKESDP